MSIGKCALCGNTTTLTFEHIPPQCAFNDKSIFIKGHEHLVEQDSPLYGKQKRSHRGLGHYSLCKNCNNLTGAWYAKDFCEFAVQGMALLHSDNNQKGVITGNYLLKPLNVLKQILVMFLAIDRTDVLRDIPGLTDFLLDKENSNFPSALKIYLYSNSSSFKRMIGYCVIYDPLIGICKCSEINFQPFGYFLTIDANPPNRFMVDITSFKNFSYNQNVEIKMTTAYLKVSNEHIGVYDNA